MAWHGTLYDMAYDDEELYDRAKAMKEGPAVEPPSHPYGLTFSIAPDKLAEAGLEDGEPGDTSDFSAMGEVTSCHRSTKDSRVEVRLTQFAGEDGQFVDLGADDASSGETQAIPFPTSAAPTISLQQRELDKLGLDADCEIGDTIHLVGQVRLESTSKHEYGGECCQLQITHLASVENESEESRDGG